MALQITITDAGIAEITNAANSGTAPVEIIQAGLGSGKYATNPAQTAMQAETKRLNSITGLVVADDTIHITVKDDSADVYAVSEIGLYTASGTLFAVYSDQANDFIDKLSGSTLMLAVDIKLSNVNAANITFGSTEFTNPPASETVQGVVELASQAEALAATDNLKAMTPLRVLDLIAQFGIGKDYTTYTSDLNTLLSGGTFAFNSGSANAPFDFGIVFVTPRASGEIEHLAIQHGTGIVATRSRLADASFTAWNSQWSANRQGANSGMDSDMVDGLHAQDLKDYTDQQIASLVASSPAALDTLNELATALGNDPNFATTMTNALAGKEDKTALKTGAYADKTNSVTDSTLGRLLKVGDFGLGYTESPYVSNLDTLNVNGVFAFNIGTTGAPCDFGICFVTTRAGGELEQTVIQHGTGVMWTRGGTTATWSGWRVTVSVSTTTAPGETNLEIGTMVVVIAQATGVAPNLNAAATVKLRTDSSTGYTDTGTGATMVGDWRARGSLSGQQIYFLAQRVA